MNKDISTTTFAAIAVVLVLLLLLIGWTVFGRGGDRMDAATIQAHMKLKSSKEDR